MGIIAEHGDREIDAKARRIEQGSVEIELNVGSGRKNRQIEVGKVNYCSEGVCR